IVTSDEEDRRDLDWRIIDIYERGLGPDHPRTLDARFLAARAIDDPEVAEHELGVICPRLLRIDPLVAGECELEYGRLEFARGQFEAGRHLMTLALEHLAIDDKRRVLVDAYLALGTGMAELASDKLSKRIAADEQLGSDDWWVVTAQAERRLLLGWLLEDAQ